MVGFIKSSFNNLRDWLTGADARDPLDPKKSENLSRNEVGGKLFPGPVPNRPKCQKSHPFWEKCFQKFDIAKEKIFDPRKIFGEPQKM